MGDGEPAHFITGARSVRTAGQETGRFPASDHAAQAGLEDQVLRNAGFDVGAYVVTAVVVSVDITLLVQVAGGDEVTGLVVSALHGDIVFLGDAGAEYALDVVHIVPTVRGVAVEHGLHIALGEIRHVFLFRRDGAARQLVHHLGQVVVVGELRSVHEPGEVGVHGGAHRPVVREPGVALVTLAGRDDDHAARRLQAIDRRRSAVLQDRDALDVGRVDVVYVVHGIAVHDIGHAIDRSADAEGRLIQARLTGFLDGGYARKLAAQHLGDIGRRCFQELVALDGRYGRRQGLLLGRTVADDDNILQEQSIFLQDDVDG